MTSAYDFRQWRRIYERGHCQALNGLRQSERMDESEILSLRDESCGRFPRGAREDSPYWREVFDNLDIRPDDLTVDGLPVLYPRSRSSSGFIVALSEAARPLLPPRED